jgi:hypothetical protein
VFPLRCPLRVGSQGLGPAHTTHIRIIEGPDLIHAAGFWGAPFSAKSDAANRRAAAFSAGMGLTSASGVLRGIVAVPLKQEEAARTGGLLCAGRVEYDWRLRGEGAPLVLGSEAVA